MPLSINVGLGRKASRNYLSRSVFIGLTAELHQTLLSRPEELQQRIQDLYAQAESAQRQQMTAPVRADPSPRQRDHDGHHSGANGIGERGNRRSVAGNNGASMTAGQCRAVLAITRAADTDPGVESQDMVGLPLNQLSVADASSLTDHVKAIQSQRAG